MKLTFTFTESPDLKSLTRDDIYQSHFEFPDTALQLLDVKERILAIADLVGQSTGAVLHVTCKDISPVGQPIRLTKAEGSQQIRHSWWNLVICFSRISHNRSQSRYLKIRLPILAATRWHGEFISPTYWGRDDEQKRTTRLVREISEHCLTLLNSEPTSANGGVWQFVGFYPYRKERAAIDRFNKLSKKRAAEERRRERQLLRQQKLEAKAAQTKAEGQPSQAPPTTGAGRRVGAVPGVFKGVQFRSQLEIRFVTQLEAKQIRWVYEGERLGEGNYLVDFYLPDLKCWVEVKGRLEPRDDYLLKEVAAYLKRERRERLFVYTQSKAFTVTDESFKSLTHDQFWSRL